MGNGQESSDDVRVHEHTVVLLRGRNIVLTQKGGIVQVIPVSSTVQLVSLPTFILHISSNVEAIAITSSILIVKSQVSSDFDGSVSIHNNHVFIGSESQTHNEGVNCHGVIVCTTSCSVAVTQSHKSVNLGLLSCLSPCSDGQESAHNVTVDGEVKELIRRVHASLIESASASEVVPILLLQQGVHLRPNIKEIHSGFICTGGYRGGVIELLAIGESEGETGSQKEHSVELAHILFQLGS